MATRKQKEDLLKVLSFTPHTVEISLSGYGGEIVMGRVDADTYDYWNYHGNAKLVDFAQLNYVDADPTFALVPKQHQFITPGSWYDCDDLAHATGVEMSSHCRLVVYDTTHNRHMFECDLDLANLDSAGIKAQRQSDVDLVAPGTAVFVGQSIEKGTFFSAELELTKPFDLGQLSIAYSNYNGWTLANGVEYQGQYLDGYDNGSTVGKSFNFEMFVTESAEAAHPDSSAKTTPHPTKVDESVMTGWFTFRKHQPVYPGLYQVLLESTLYPVQFATWKNNQWQYNNTTPVEFPVSAWRGLNYCTV
jgi:hypothetical protein